jgi:hypothetical protein
MKTLMYFLLTFTFAAATIALAQQDTTSSPQQQQDNSQMRQDSSQPQQHSMSGKVSGDGKTFVSDQDNTKWKVSNPDALKGYENQQVMLVMQVDPATNQIHIVSLQPETPPKQ